MKAKELMSMTVDDLNTRVVDLKQELAKERASIVSGTRNENPGKVKKLRKDIARILTVVKQKEAKKSAGN